MKSVMKTRDWGFAAGSPEDRWLEAAVEAAETQEPEIARTMPSKPHPYCTGIAGPKRPA